MQILCSGACLFSTQNYKGWNSTGAFPLNFIDFKVKSDFTRFSVVLNGNEWWKGVRKTSSPFNLLFFRSYRLIAFIDFQTLVLPSSTLVKANWFLMSINFDQLKIHLHRRPSKKTQDERTIFCAVERDCILWTNIHSQILLALFMIVSQTFSVLRYNFMLIFFASISFSNLEIVLNGRMSKMHK